MALMVDTLAATRLKYWETASRAPRGSPRLLIWKLGHVGAAVAVAAREETMTVERRISVQGLSARRLTLDIE